MAASIIRHFGLEQWALSSVKMRFDLFAVVPIAYDRIKTLGFMAIIAIRAAGSVTQYRL
jgi:hypothetical protein